MNHGIGDIEKNTWGNESRIGDYVGPSGQIEYWRDHYRFHPDELAELNAWVKAEGLESVGIDAPTYYDFPGGVQVRDISAHLTSFGGQALQYVARATRLDGNNKGEAVKDLRKAIDFIGWEIERLESNA